MLTTTTKHLYGASEVESTLVLEQRFRLHLMRRSRLTSDTRFLPSARYASGVTLYIVLAGSTQIDHEPVVEGACAYLLAEHEFERITPTASRFRTWGAPNVTFELRLAAGDVRVPVGIAAGPLALSPPTWALLRAFTNTCAVSLPGTDHVRDVLRGLEVDGIIAGDVLASVRDVEHETFVRLWAAIQPYMVSHAMSTSARAIARAAGRSLRQLGRDSKDFARHFDLGDNFREAARLIRLRMAILLLSSPGATATEVARYVGYKSLEAMERAFRDARMPPPSAVIEATRYPG